MALFRTPPSLAALLAIIAFVIAAVCFAGMVLRDDAVGRIIYGVVWSAVGILWVWQFVTARRERAAKAEEADSE